MIQLCPGIITTVTTFVLENFDDEELKQIGSICKQVFLVFPHYCLGRGLMDMATEAGLNALVGQFGEWRVVKVSPPRTMSHSRIGVRQKSLGLGFSGTISLLYVHTRISVFPLHCRDTKQVLEKVVVCKETEDGG